MQFYIFGGVSMPTQTYHNDLWMLSYQQIDISESTDINGCIWNEIEAQGKVC